VNVRLLTVDTDPPLRAYVRGHLSRAAILAGARCGRVTVAVVDDRHMAELHRRFRGAGGSTDVLTFDLSGAAGGPLDADIVVSADEARRQARRRGHAARAEVLLYALHGLLHLLGHDDRDRAGAAAMHAREDQLLGALGVGPVYGGGSRQR
jgi:probable rRNA maturation factor